MFHPQEQLRRPLQESHGGSRQLFHCPQCGKQYNTQLGYRRHLVAAHGSAGLPCPEAPGLAERPGDPAAAAAAVRERKYSCERCDRRFYTRKDVRRHAVVHTGRRDFLCPRCAQRFGRRDHLTRHLKKSHAQEGNPCPVKEEPGPVPCGDGAPKELPEAFPGDVYGSYAGPMPPGGAAGHHMPPPHQQAAAPPLQQPYRYQHGSTSYPRADADSFLLDLQSGLPPHLAAPPSSPQREALPEAMGAGDPHVDLGPLLGFLPFSLPPYGAHMGMGGLVMGYPPTSTGSPPSSSQGPGPFALLQPPQGPAAHSQLPQGYSSPARSTSTLPRYYQAFQQ